MFRILPETDGKFFALEVLGKLTDADYETLIPQLETIITAHGKLRLFADLSAFEGWEWRAAYDDIAFGVKHWNDIECLALVGEARWEKLAATIMDKISAADVRYFPTTGRDDALNWARG